MDELDLLKCHSLHEVVERIQDIKTRNTKNCTFHEVQTGILASVQCTAFIYSWILCISNRSKPIIYSLIYLFGFCSIMDELVTIGEYTVLGTTRNARASCLFPVESCTCPSSIRCYHILAVRMTVGLKYSQCNKTVNLTQLRRNTRTRREKKSGRKAPRPGDYDIIPAPDASKDTLTIYIVNSMTVYRRQLKKWWKVLWKKERS